MLLLIIVHQYTHCMYICISNQCVRRGLRKLLRLAQTEIICPTIGTKVIGIVILKIANHIATRFVFTTLSLVIC